MEEINCREMRGEDETAHTRREPNLLAARFHSDLSLGRTEVFLVASDWDEERAEASGGETKASFHSDGSSNTGSSPTSSDLIDVRTRASSSSRAGGATVP